MKTKRLSQETLKLIACVSMLIDHIGAVIVAALLRKVNSGGGNAEALLELYKLLRIIGRLAFPIYCFLLTEGIHYTKNPGRYALRLLIAAVLAEIPFDYAIYGDITWQHQNVMVTLLLGFCGVKAMERCPDAVTKILCAVVFSLAAKWANCDYGAKGIWTILLFALTREHSHRNLLQILGLWLIFSPDHAMFLNWLNGRHMTVQEWAVLSLIPISCYNGTKQSGSKVLQRAFYLFYPVHLLALELLKLRIFG